LNKEQLIKLDRKGMCNSCHQEMPSGDLAVSAMVHVSEMAGMTIDKEVHGTILNKLLLLGAWVQILGGMLLGGLVVYLYLRGRRYMKCKKG
jgi:hypothetical protein